MPHPSSRFKISLTPFSLPGKCIICGSVGGDGRKFVDFGFDIDYYGTVVFCSVCLTECCNYIGWINETQWTELNKSNEELTTRVQNLEADNVHLRNALSSLNLVNNHSTKPNNGSYSGEQTPEKPRKTIVLDRSNSSQKRSDDSGSVESVNESGREDISDSNKHESDDDESSADSGFTLDL